ncbi:MAG: EAL domain-containing protein [Shinella sp.]|nr:EAL domain-containing protein [Shinella sp.]
MTDGIRQQPEDGETARLIRIAQAEAVHSGVSLSLVANTFVATTTAVVMWLHQPVRPVLYWIAAILALNAARLVVLKLIAVRNIVKKSPETALHLLSAGAFLSGLLWAGAPFLQGEFRLTGFNAYVILVLGGMSAGALMQSTAYARTALVFVAPLLVSAVVALFLTNTPVSMVIAADILLLSIVMLRTSRLSEEAFIRSQADRLRAVSLALSLSDANAEIRQSYRQLSLLASQDPLTGLSNRALFNQRLRAILDESDRPPASLAILAIDLDRFKAINDTMGHGAGDVVLREISRRLSSLAGEGDTVARLGGDEFAVIVEGADAPDRGHLIGEGIVKLAEEPVDIGGRPVVIGASAGLALYPDHGETAETLFASADIALYAAKQGGRRRLGMFNPALRARIERQRRIESGLPEALEQGELVVLFQPQISLLTGRVVGFEALLRWNHPELGPVSPPEIVQAAHALHIAYRLTAYVATRAAAFLKTLPQLGLDGIPVAINVSPREFSGSGLSALLVGITADHGVDPALLEIEITEEATLDAAAAGPELARLEAAGFRLAVDDFGMGHSSLAYLVSLRIDRLKIDRSFVNGIATSRENQTLISALIGIGLSLSIDIIIEGVETADEAEILRMLGCRFAQGYHFAQPMSAGEVAAWLAGRDATPALSAAER